MTNEKRKKRWLTHSATTASTVIKRPNESTAVTGILLSKHFESTWGEPT